MSTSTQEQLARRVQFLENKLKKYALVLKKRNHEVVLLKNEILRLSKDEVDFASLLSSASLSEMIQQSNVEPNPLPEREEEVSRALEKKSAEEVNPQTSPLPEGEGESSHETFNIPAIHFKVGEFLSRVLDGEEDADEMKAKLQRLEQCEKNDRRNIMLSITKLHWQMIDKMATRLLDQDLPWEKRLFMRFGMLDDRLMSDRKEVWDQLYSDQSKPDGSGIYYIDEWFEAIAKAELNYSLIDEMALDGKKPDPKAAPELAIKYERLTVPQMQRMCVGARANTVSLLTQEYCAPGRDNPVINRPWLLQSMKDVMKHDYQIFQRKYKGEEFEVQPLIIITPGYGQKSGCWEPWSLGQKGTTGPRICICAFPPKNSLKALLHGIADYRWEYAKADAMHYWLSEGLTGKWLALFNKKEQRLDLKGIFIESYYHWVVNESRRRPKLEKRFRDYFWHNIPYSDAVKESLKGGGMFGRLIELEEAKKKREAEEREEMERIQAEREARKAARLAKLEGQT